MNYLSNEFEIVDNDYQFLKPILQAVVEVSRKLDFDFIVIGATARDFLIKYVFETDLKLRATKDIDFAILIDNWQKYEAVVKELITNFGFIEGDQKQRLIYHTIPLDIIPFGKIAAGDSIFWPPENSIEMAVTGFKEVFDSGVYIKYDDLKFRILSLEGLFISKLIAWHERKAIKKTDAEDLGTIIYHYNDFYPVELFDKYSYLIDSPDYDYLLAGVQILGIKLRKFLDNYPELLQKIISILQDEIHNEENAELAINLSSIESNDTNLRALDIILEELMK
jgi:predicted nucleotidyltransferase